MKQCVFPPGRNIYVLVITVSVGQGFEQGLISSRMVKLKMR